MQRLRLYYPKEGNASQKIGNRIGECLASWLKVEKCCHNPRVNLSMSNAPTVAQSKLFSVGLAPW